jgi:hypothetical protein
MKKIIVAILLTCSSTVFAQTEMNYNFSIGIRGVKIAQMPKILQQTSSDELTTMFLNGGMLKFNDNQISYRISGYYYYQPNKKFNNLCNTCEAAEGSMSDYTLKLGFEKNFNYSVVQPYFGMDLGYRQNNFDGLVKPISNLSLNSPYTASTTKNGFIIAPILGLKVNVIPNLSFYVETGLDLMYSYERQETVTNNLSATRTFNRYTKFELLTNAISAGIQIHFSGNN